MKKWMIIAVVCCWLLSGCAAFSQKGKMEKYGRTMDSYEIAMRISDLNAVCRLVDPSAMSRQTCLDRFGDIKLVDYKVMDMQVDEENMAVTQDIKVSYHFMDDVRVKDLEYEQTWYYLEDSEQWLLRDGPPQFE